MTRLLITLLVASVSACSSRARDVAARFDMCPIGYYVETAPPSYAATCTPPPWIFDRHGNKLDLHPPTLVPNRVDTTTGFAIVHEPGEYGGRCPVGYFPGSSLDDDLPRCMPPPWGFDQNGYEVAP